MSAHTGGPWRKRGDVVYGVDGSRVGSVLLRSDKDAEGLANLALIVAAPEMLAALRLVLANAEDAEATLDCDGELLSDIAAVRSAISKATGGAV